MKNLLRSLIVIFLVLMFSSTALADPYISGQFGGFFQKDTTDVGFSNIIQSEDKAYGGSGGYDWGFFRAEFEGLHVEHDLKISVPVSNPTFPNAIKNIDLSTTYYFINGYFDWSILDDLELYGGGGVDLGGNGFNATIGGIGHITENWGVYISGRYLFTDVVEDAPMFMFGVRYTFD